MLTPFGHQFLAFLGGIRPGSRLRLAPTPSGYLHLGNGLNFVLNWLAARSCPGATLLLRIDDLDAARKRPEYVRDIFDTLHWLALDWDEGPRDAPDFEAGWSQGQRLPLYQQALEQLRAGGYLFACAKSRNDLAPYDGDYPIVFREQGVLLDTPDTAWRIKTPREQGEPIPPDFVVRRRDGVPAYQLASVVDDRHYSITHAIRGADLTPSTAAQQYLARCLGWADFLTLQFLHHPLVQGIGGEKLSKSAGAESLHHLQAGHRSPAPVFQLVSTWLGLPKPAESANELLEILLRSRTNDF